MHIRDEFLVLVFVLVGAASVESKSKITVVAQDAETWRVIVPPSPLVHGESFLGNAMLSSSAVNVI